MSDDDLKRKAAHAALDLLPEQRRARARHGLDHPLVHRGGGRAGAGRPTVLGGPTSQASRRLAQSSASPCSTTPVPGRSSCASTAPTRSADAGPDQGRRRCAYPREDRQPRRRRNVIIVDETKLSARLGEKRKVPVEVLPFGAKATAAALAELGRPQLRERGGTPLRPTRATHLRPRGGAARRPARWTGCCAPCRAWSRPACSWAAPTW